MDHHRHAGSTTTVPPVAPDGSVVLSLGFSPRAGFAGIVDGALRIETASGVGEVPLVAVIGD